uniref:Ovule protein n=1 Tax=Ascaris lumbricoides TaxID=6252 RepID=A0A0M3I2U7_ASCLU
MPPIKDNKQRKTPPSKRRPYIKFITTPSPAYHLGSTKLQSFKERGSSARLLASVSLETEIASNKFVL